MDNDLFIATETLQSAFEEVLKNEKVKSRKWGMRGQVKRLKEAIEQRHLTVSEKLLLCYGSDEELFSSRDSQKKIAAERKEKRTAISDEFMRIYEEYKKLPEEEQDRVRKELELDKVFPWIKSPENNTTTPFELNKNKGQKNGK